MLTGRKLNNSYKSSDIKQVYFVSKKQEEYNTS